VFGGSAWLVAAGGAWVARGVFVDVTKAKDKEDLIVDFSLHNKKYSKEGVRATKSSKLKLETVPKVRCVSSISEEEKGKISI